VALFKPSSLITFKLFLGQKKNIGPKRAKKQSGFANGVLGNQEKSLKKTQLLNSANKQRAVWILFGNVIFSYLTKIQKDCDIVANVLSTTNNKINNNSSINNNNNRNNNNNNNNNNNINNNTNNNNNRNNNNLPLTP